MKQKITDIAGQLALLPIDKVESIDHFSSEYDEIGKHAVDSEARMAYRRGRLAHL